MELVVSRIPSKKVMHDFVVDYCERLGRVPGKMDDVLNWVAGPEGAGVYIGHLNGKPITGVAMIQHNDTYAWVGLYFCEEQYHGKGYAFKTWKVARAAVNPQANIGLDAVLSASSLYEREGFKKAWSISYCNFIASAILEVYRNLVVPDCITFKSATKVDFLKLRLYVEDVMGLTFAQSGLLEKFISLPTHKALVAVRENGDIVGFSAIRESINLDETGYRLAPVMADSGDIARLLLLMFAKEVKSDRKFFIHVPSGANPEAKKIEIEVKGKKYVDLVRMYTKCELPIKKEKYFGVFSVELLG